ncbi:glycerophosphodiester phosphodiesterase family protein [Viscerimonas tarda]
MRKLTKGIYTGIGLFIVILTIVWLAIPSPESFRCERFPILIAHGGGGINGQIRSNSREAVELSVKNGYCFIELDMQITKDGHIAAVHFWSDLYEQTGLEGDTIPLSSADFKLRKIQGYQHTLLGNDIKELFPDTVRYLVTDKIKDYDLIIKEIEVDKNKLLVEVFSYPQYLDALQKGIKYPMLNTINFQKLRKYSPLLIAKKIKMITVPVEMISSCEKELRFLHKYGVTIFAYTSNDKDFILKHGGKTVSGFYTDYVKISDL